MELSGLLQYIVNQLKDDNSLDLMVLKELLAKMGGIEIIEDLSEEQLESQAGGEILRSVCIFDTSVVTISYLLCSFLAA